MSRTVLLVAGEASGDLHASRVARRLRAVDPSLVLVGIGGSEMERAGVRILAPMRRLSVVGLTEVATRLPKILASYRALRRLFRSNPPDLFIAVDFPGMNLRLARLAHAHGVPVLYYIAPQVWAWWRGRIRVMREAVDQVAVIFPFEEPLYREGGVPARFVGHPIVEELEETVGSDPPAPLAGLAGRPLVGLFPGSRKAEVTRILPALLETAAALHARRPESVFALGVADTIMPSLIEAQLARARGRLGAALPPIEIVRGASHALMARARAAVVASGTATLEAAWLGCPMAIVYRVSPVTWWCARRLVRLPYVGLPNFVLGRPAVPEFLQGRLRAEDVARCVEALLDDGSARSAMLADLAVVRDALGSSGASERTAQMALALLTRRNGRVGSEAR